MSHKAIDMVKTNQDGPQSDNEAVLRKKALKRSWICPGAGFAFGNGTAALATYVASLCIVPSVAWFAFLPNSTSFWTAVAFIVIASVLWLVEQVTIQKATLPPSSPSLLDRGFVVSACGVWLASAVAVGLLVTAFGSIRTAGAGMMPTLEPSEMLIYHKRVDWQSVKR